MDQALRIRESCFGINGKCIIDKIILPDGSIRKISVRELYQYVSGSQEPVKLYDSTIHDFTSILSIHKYPDPHNWIIFKIADETILLAASTFVLTQTGYRQPWELRPGELLLSSSDQKLKIEKRSDLGFRCQSSFCIQTESSFFDSSLLRHHYHPLHDEFDSGLLFLQK